MNRPLAILAGLGGPVRHRSRRSRGFMLPPALLAWLVVLIGALAAFASPLTAYSSTGKRMVPMRATAKQAEFINSDVKQVVFCAGIGSGKTFCGSRFAYRMVCQYPKTLGLITANTYKQLAQSTIAEFKKFLDTEGVPYVFGREPKWYRSRLKGTNAHSNVFSFPNGAQIVCRSLQNFEDVRGAEYGWWWGDETRDTAREAYDVVIGRLREINGPGYTRLTTTPNGYDWLYEVFFEEPAADPSLRTQRKLIRAATMENRRNLPPGYIELLKRSYDPILAKQEIYGKFVPIGVGTVYSCFQADANARADVCDYRPWDSLLLGCDFNANFCVWVICQEREVVQPDGTARECIVCIDEIVKEYTTPGLAMTESMAREFIKRYGGHRGRIEIFGDYYGHSGSATTTRTDWGIVLDVIYEQWDPEEDRRVGFHVPKLPEEKSEAHKGGNPAVIDRVNAVNARWRNSKQQISAYVHPQKCKTLVKDCQRVTWKESTKKREIDKQKDLKLTHASDAYGYVVYGTMRARPGQWSVGGVGAGKREDLMEGYSS